MDQECIAAIATPPGIGALAIVRMSGAGSLDVLDRVFRGDGRTLDVKGRGVFVGRVIDPASGEPVDDVVATVFRGPRSYTGEDMIEVGCHGGRYVPVAVLEACLHAGARVAEPGEFTRRACLNGKLDLIQAEGVAAMIGATTRRAHRVALEQLHRALSREIEALRGGLVELIARLEYEIDFPDGEALEGGWDGIRARAEDVRDRIAAVLETWREGAMVMEGALVVIAGRANVGKSSIFNRMARCERAIVTAHPGTTRDAIEQEIALCGLRVRLVDTAGLREPQDEVERLGVEVSQRYLDDADVVLFVTEAGESPREEERTFLENLRDRLVLCVGNKVDRVPGLPRGTCRASEPMYVSALTGEGFEGLRERIVDLALGGRERERPAISTVRQRNGLEAALRDVERAVTGVREGLSAEFLAEDLRGAAGALAGLIGEVTGEEVLDEIFSTFCVGK